MKISTASPPTPTPTIEHAPLPEQDLATWVRAGLERRPRALPPLLFYDARGSELFEAICKLPEYYLTRAECSILETQCDAIAAACDDVVTVAELGSGSSVKTEILLHALVKSGRRVRYVPIDISEAAVVGAAQRLETALPGLEIRGLVAEFETGLARLNQSVVGQCLVVFLGSNLGNFAPSTARRFLRAVRTAAGENGRLLLGLDLVKDPAILKRAYDDAQGVTAAFNLNVLRRINEALGGVFKLEHFRHRAQWNPSAQRIEIHLVSTVDQRVHIEVLDTWFDFAAGETIKTENSYKFTFPGIDAMAAATGWRVGARWLDDDGYFSLQLLEPSTSSATSRDPEREQLLGRLHAIRDASVALCQPLEIEDYSVQSMPTVSPPKWHLAHTTWYFERFLLRAFKPDYTAIHADYEFLFNSYYEAVGERHPRPERGLVTRPTVREVLAYRSQIDAALAALVDCAPQARWPEIAFLLELGVQHEQQHQELLLMDIKHILFQNRIPTAYQEQNASPAGPTPLGWTRFDAALRQLGYDGKDFAFDNERPRHPIYVAAFEIANRCVTNGEYLAFVEAGGYDNPQLWLSDGWAAARSEDWQAPLYWRKHQGAWWEFTLAGWAPLDPDAPVCHVSFYEADAYARWGDARLPTEEEWETAASEHAIDGNFVESGQLHPRAARGDGLTQIFGDVWEWTRSAYAPYPGFKPFAGALGEYNGKYMANQQVLRGGCCFTPRAHVRATYRNFFYPHERWAMQGFRLAR